MSRTSSEFPGEIHGRVADVDVNACARATGPMHATGAVAKVGGKSWLVEHAEIHDARRIYDVAQSCRHRTKHILIRHNLPKYSNLHPL